jgi:hypothetical protein
MPGTNLLVVIAVILLARMASKHELLVYQPLHTTRMASGNHRDTIITTIIITDAVLHQHTALNHTVVGAG